MRRLRDRSCRRGALLGAIGGAAFVALAACGGDDPVAAGGVCSLASDCQPGLVCVPAGGKSVCSDDLSKVAGQTAPDGATPGPADGGEGGSPRDGATPGDAATPIRDTGAPDTSRPDTGPADTGAG